VQRTGTGTLLISVSVTLGSASVFPESGNRTVETGQ